MKNSEIAHTAVPTVTIGIPAFNEEANIKYLMQEIFKQSENGFALQSVIIASDGSTDKTVAILKSMNNPRIQIIDGKNRLGVAKRQNEIMDSTFADILIILNADISIPDNHFIEKIIEPVLNGKADLVTPQYKQMEPITFFEKILYTSAQLKLAIYDSYKNGNNIYTCCGPARAFSKRLYSKLRFKTSANEDAYSYLFTVTNGFTYLHTHATGIYFRLPNNFSDHKKQSTRFINSKKILESEFSREIVQKNYYLPVNLLLKKVTQFFFRYPIEMIAYICILASITVFSPYNMQESGAWETSKSSKVVHK